MQETFTAQRLSRFGQILRQTGFQAMVLTSPANLFYFTGVWLETGERPNALIMIEGKDPVWVVHKMFAEEVQGVPIRAHFWQDGESPYKIIAEEMGAKRIYGVDGSWETRHVLQLMKAVETKDVPILGDDVIRRVRVCKDAEELASLEKASQLADEVVGRMKAELSVGQTEAAMAEHLVALWRNSEAQDMSFPPILAAAKNGAAPHHEPDASPLRANSTVIIDTGGVYRHYCSDITRTFILGEPTQEIRTVYQLVLDAQRAGIAAAKPGVTLEEVDRACRAVIEEGGYGEYFTHRTGHGVGIEIHEAPFVVTGNTEKLEVGMVMSVEPGIYLPGKFGVRIEDLVVIEAGGARSLNHAPKELNEVICRI